jgi:hypothetical protein
MLVGPGRLHVRAAPHAVYVPTLPPRGGEERGGIARRLCTGALVRVRGGQLAVRRGEREVCADAAFQARKRAKSALIGSSCRHVGDEAHDGGERKGAERHASEHAERERRRSDGGRRATAVPRRATMASARASHSRRARSASTGAASRLRKFARPCARSRGSVGI